MATKLQIQNDNRNVSADDRQPQPKVLVTARAKGEVAAAAIARKAARRVNDISREVRLEAFESLSEHGDARWEKLAVIGLRDPEDTVVVSALECLVSWQSRRHVAKAVRLLDSPSDLVRTYAAWATGRLGNARQVQALRRRKRRAGDTAERTALLEALFTITGDRRYFKDLLKQLKSTNVYARAFTTNSLVGVANVRNVADSIGSLARALSSEKSEFVAAAIRRDLVCLVELTIEWHTPLSGT